jgi:hypothetical protein
VFISQKQDDMKVIENEVRQFPIDVPSLPEAGSKDRPSPAYGPSIAVLILGMHRSGTSALAGMLNFAGLDLGGNLTPGHEDNPKGFFEHDEIWQIHDELLRETGTSWQDTRQLPPDWQQNPPANLVRDRLDALLRQNFAGKPLWGIKDPRLSRIFGIWPELLDGLGAEARVVLAVRHPMEVAASLTLRDGLDPAHGLALWLRYTLDAERNTRGLKRAIQHYPDMLGNWRAELARLGAVLELPLPEPTAQTAAAIDGFLDSAMRHHRAGADWADHPQPLVNWCAQAYGAMLTLPDADALRSLDAIQDAFDGFEREAAAYTAQISAHLSEIKLYRNANQWLESERAAQEAAIAAAAAADAKTAAAERARFAAELEREAEDRKNLQAAHDELRNELHRLQASSSWRLTQPLRNLLRHLRQVKARRHSPAPEPFDDDMDAPALPRVVVEDHRVPAVVSVPPEPSARPISK